MFLIFDTETTGLPKNYNAPVSNSDNWPRMVQIAWQLHGKEGNLISFGNYIIKPEDYTIPYNAEKIHGISTERALRDGHDLTTSLEAFEKDITQAKYVIGHNISFDISIAGAEFFRKKLETKLPKLKIVDTKNESTNYCALSGGKGGQFKWPTLTELHTKLFGVPFDDAHDAAFDVDATTKCFFELVKKQVITFKEISNPKNLVYEPPTLTNAPFKETVKEINAKSKEYNTKNIYTDLDNTSFSHLHNHSQYSVLQSTTELKALVEKAIKDKMPAIALTDLGNLMGAFHFIKTVLTHNKTAKNKNEELVRNGGNSDQHLIKPILGCEFNVCLDHTDKKNKDNGYQIVLLAKNKAGYHNLAKLSSIAHVNGFYYIPRIDKKLIVEYKENLIALSGGIRGEIPDLILNTGEAQAEEALLWWKEQFGNDFYIELSRHKLEENKRTNDVLLQMANKYDIKYFAANNTFYMEKSDAYAHDILLCVKEGEKKNTPIGRGRGYRYGFPNDEFYFKTQEEMKKLFADLPDAIKTTNEIVEKVEIFDLAREVLLPKFNIPEKFKDSKDEEDGGKRGENAYLKHLTYIGAKNRYKELTDEINERIDFELKTIANTGYPGYFLIVQDFTKAARDMGVWVGPGRGSAAGSVVAYCTGITNVDPIKYNLLFERFLNPDRVSLPDIDIDFDDEGREKVINWVVEKYGSSQVAQIITYGTMAAKSSIRDTARVLDLPLYEADRIAKLVPPDIKLNMLFNLTDEQLKEKLNPEQFVQGNELKKIASNNDLAGETVKQAIILEGSVRNTGTHACGIIITPDDITRFIPVASAKDSSLYVTQFDNSVVESAGLLKMDFLGLKTLTLIKDALIIIKSKHNITIDPDTIPLDDIKTFELFQKGETVGVFQFESPGMQKHLKGLKPDKFGDLIAMNALYRPGPLEYIPHFIKRKHGEEDITFDLPEMEEHLKETYGITVYQEQVMLLSQKIAGFTKGEADILRKAMGKKQKDVLDKMKGKFIEGATKKGHPEDKLEKIWKDWEAFAQYAFNKSHSTCYALIAFHSAYIKANYPAEYMASVMSNNMNDISSITFFMEECKRMGMKVLGPDVNESYFKFAVNQKGQIRFGLGAIKGVGESAVMAIVNERKAKGNYTSIFDLTRRIDLKAANKKAFESLALAGAFDSFNITRAQYFFQPENENMTVLEKAVRYGSSFQESKNSAQVSLFEDSNDTEMPEPIIPECENWGTLQTLSKEKEVVGIYISGHPLDDFKFELKHFCKNSILDLKELENLKGQDISFAGIVTDIAHRMTKTGKPFGSLTIEDYSDSFQLMLFSQDYVDFRNYLNVGWFLFIKARVQTRPWDDTQLEVKISKIELLQDIKTKMSDSITIKLNLIDIQDSLIENLSNHMKNNNNGKCKVCFDVRDWNENIDVSLPSRTLRVDISNEFIDLLHTNDIPYKVN